MQLEKYAFFLDCEDIVESFQEQGFSSAETGALLRWLQKHNKYIAGRNKHDFQRLSNAYGVKLLRAEGHPLDSRLLIDAPAPVVDALLDAGVRIHSTGGADRIPTPISLRQLLRRQRAEAMGIYSTSRLLQSRDVLAYVSLLREFDYQVTAEDLAPCMSIPDVACALFTFQFIVELPPEMWKTKGFTLFGDGYGHFMTHRAFPSLADEVFTVLCCLLRVCPQLPRDLRKLLLIAAFGLKRSGGGVDETSSNSFLLKRHDQEF